MSRAIGLEDELPRFLEQYGVEWTPLDEAAHRETETAWRTVYSSAFHGKRLTRHRNGFRAEFEFEQEKCSHYFIVPFSADIPLLPVRVIGRRQNAYECRGLLVPLGAFHSREFFISPLDFGWTMIHTHEDHAFGGPYFFRAEWLP